VKDNVRSIALLSTLMVILLMSSIPAFAAELDATVDPLADAATVTFVATRTIMIEYEPSSSLGRELEGANENITIAKSESDFTTDMFVSTLNDHLTNDKDTTSRVDGISRIAYASHLEANGTLAQLRVTLQVDASITNVILTNEQNDETTLVDANWRDIVITAPVYVETDEFAGVNINSPMGILEITHPNVTSVLSNSDAGSVVNDALLDFSAIGEVPLDSWNITQSGETTTYSLGKSTMGDDALSAQVDMDDGSIVKVSSITPPQSAQITVQAANVRVVPEFPTMVIFSLLGLMIIAVLVYTRGIKQLSFGHN
jgi:hypothetical protein